MEILDKIIRLLELMDIEPMTPSEARQLKGI
jgi:hypothetical protein